MRIHSHSSLGSFENCPRQYRYQYIGKPDMERVDTIEAFLGDPEALPPEARRRLQRFLEPFESLRAKLRKKKEMVSAIWSSSNILQVPGHVACGLDDENGRGRAFDPCKVPAARWDGHRPEQPKSPFPRLGVLHRQSASSESTAHSIAER